MKQFLYNIYILFFMVLTVYFIYIISNFIYVYRCFFPYSL